MILRAVASALLLAAAPLGSLVAPAAAIAQMAPFVLDPLPYAENALEPVIDAETMRLHHGAHHKAYVDNLNKAVSENPALQQVSLQRMMAEVSKHGKAVRDNGGGHWNHTFFWNLMAPEGQRGAPSAALRTAIDRQFGSMEKMQQAFEAAGRGQFGSGWAWLIVRPDGSLKVTATANQDNPLMDVVPEAERGAPILGNDVWEHAYYLNYRNRRGEYLSRWWEVVNWGRVNELYAEAVAKAGAR
jgi:Fe-Mn family superoxide dismutase